MSKSPEMLNGKGYSEEVDVWAFGTIAHELATGKKFPMHIRKLLKVWENPIPPIPSHLSNSFQNFIDRCLDKNDDTRWTISQLL